MEFDKNLFEKVWNYMHTPLRRDKVKIGRNQICPLCKSGKKFKHCECSKTYTINYVNGYEDITKR